jgi:hypothetical protein
MTNDVHIPNAGAPDPELKNSPIFDHESFETEAADLELETGVCYFNATRSVMSFAAAMRYCVVKSAASGYASGPADPVEQMNQVEVPREHWR